MLLKRCFDLVLAVLSAPFWVPVLILVALMVRWRLGAPVFFRQQRPGLNGRPFHLIKFRSMTDERDADGNLLPDADRLPAFGQWLRSTSLDELPELLNILKGEMSFVGPRPLLMRYLPLYSKEQARRHEAMPGGDAWDGFVTSGLKSTGAMPCPGTRNSNWMCGMWTVVRRDGIQAPGEATMPFFKGNPKDPA